MKKFLAILLAALMLVSVTACGGSSSSAADNGDNAVVEEAAQGVTDTTVKIANSMALSGAYSIVGVPMKLGMDSYIKMVNDNGGIGGRKIEFVHKDDECVPDKGKAALEEFVYDEKVFAIVGHFGTPVVGATIEDLKEYGIPAVYFATGIDSLYSVDAESDTMTNIFPVQPIYTMEGRIIAAYAKGYFGAQKVGVLYTTDDAGKGCLAGVETEAKNLGVEVVAESCQVAAADVTAQVAKLKDCDVIVAATNSTTLPAMLKEFEKQGVLKPVITSYVNVSVAITTTNAEHIQNLMHTEGAGIYALGWVDTSLAAELEKFANAMLANGATEADCGNSYAMAGWIAMDVFCQGLNRLEASGKTLTWDNYIAAMEESPVKNPFGGYIDYANGQRTGTQEMNMSRMDDTEAAGWVEVQPIQSMETILAA